MWPYWLMFLIPAFGLLVSKRIRPSQAWVPWAFIGLLFSLMIGLRHEVGSDWYTYSSQFWLYGQMSLLDAVDVGKDPGYYGLISVVSRAGGEIYTLNLICASLLVVGVVALARKQPVPWLAFLASVPYLLIVVGMGYSRQAAAIGCAMLGLVALGESRVRLFVFWIFVGATFHKTAVLLIPIAALAADRNRIWTAAWIAMMFGVGTWLFLYDSQEALVRNYVESNYANASQGAGIRVAMNAVPSVLVIMFRRKLFGVRRDFRLWMWMALLSLACLPLLMISATAVDRMALYFIPLQLVVFARLPLLAKGGGGRFLIAVSVIAYYAIVQYVWLNYAGHVEDWVPYQFMPL